MRHFFVRFLLALCAGASLAMPAHALLPAAPEPTETPAPAEQSINAQREAGEDERIAERIGGIFAELPAFRSVGVEVKEGVVTLSGEVPSAEAITRAENIAARVSGVVTVENDLERDLSVEENLSVLGKFSEIAASFLEILPLLLVALVTAIAIGLIGYLIAGFGALWSHIAPNAFLAELIRSAIRFVFVVGGIVIALDMLVISRIPPLRRFLT